jgi:DNA polymerase zeta
MQNGCVCLNIYLGRVQTEVYITEAALLNAFVNAVQALDPDIIVGFEVQKGSLGYLCDRANTLERSILRLISRSPEVTLLGSLSRP